MMRVSRNQIDFGVQIISLKPSIKTHHVGWCGIKGRGKIDLQICELAWTSFEKPVKKFFKSWVGSNAKEKTDTDRIHPTQKPIALYEWLIKNYAPQRRG